MIAVALTPNPSPEMGEGSIVSRYAALLKLGGRS